MDERQREELRKLQIESDLKLDRELRALLGWAHRDRCPRCLAKMYCPKDPFRAEVEALEAQEVLEALDRSGYGVSNKP